jgi:hypothetical protein
MKSYGFLIAHGYKVLKGYLDAESEKDILQRFLDDEWDDIIDEYDTDVLTVGYELVEFWEID